MLDVKNPPCPAPARSHAAHVLLRRHTSMVSTAVTLAVTAGYDVGFHRACPARHLLPPSHRLAGPVTTVITVSSSFSMLDSL